jgi:hypothetical protein
MHVTSYTRSAPSLGMNGDLWIRTDDGKFHEFKDGIWIEINLDKLWFKCKFWKTFAIIELAGFIGIFLYCVI